MGFQRREVCPTLLLRRFKGFERIQIHVDFSRNQGCLGIQKFRFDSENGTIVYPHLGISLFDIPTKRCAFIANFGLTGDEARGSDSQIIRHREHSRYSVRRQPGHIPIRIVRHHSLQSDLFVVHNAVRRPWHSERAAAASKRPAHTGRNYCEKRG